MTEEKSPRRLYKSRRDKIIDGVCGGVAEYFNIEPMIVRVICLVTLFINGLGFLAYAIAAVVIPPNPEHRDLKKEDVIRHNPQILWGIGLITAGMMIFMRIWHFPFCWRFPPDFDWEFWDFPWGIAGPVLLIVIGIIYVLGTFKSHDSTENTIMKTSEQTHKRLVRPEQGRMIAGVCAAFADYFNVDPTWIRIGYAFLTIITHVAPLLILYAALIFIIPKASENSTSI